MGVAPSFSKPLGLADAADFLDGMPHITQINQPGVLLLADGGRFEGQLFGAAAIGEGELVFTTGMTGYQESLTDPSFAGQVLTFTYPMIGNYGIHAKASESASVWPRGVIVRQAMANPDHRNSRCSVGEFLAAHGVPGIQAIDTRAITRRVREQGTVLCVFGPLDQEDLLVKRLSELTSPELEDLVDLVSIDEMILLNQGAVDDLGSPLPRLAAIDCGIKYNILRCLKDLNFKITVVPYNFDFEELKSLNPDGIFLSNGPGDPFETYKSIKKNFDKLLNLNLPIFGICIGHQLLALAFGAQTEKMKQGHRGANHPVYRLKDKTVEITSQNHGFKVVEETLPSFLNITHKSLFDGTIEGLEHKSKPIFSVQYHPEASPGPHDSRYLFQKFYKLISDRAKNAQKK